MSLPIHVEAYSGYKAKQRPRQFTLDEHQLRRILGAATGKRGPYEFMLTEPARCPTCKHRITEKTLIDREEIGTC